MKTLIAYSTTHGCTEKTAKELKQFLGGQTQTCNLKQNPNPELTEFDRVIIGGSIHAGQIQKRVKEYCSNNIEELKKKELGLFICCMYEGEQARTQLSDAFPEELHRRAKASACFGGEFNFAKMNFFQKMIVKKVAHVDKTTSHYNQDAVKAFSKKMDKIFNPFLFLV